MNRLRSVYKRSIALFRRDQRDADLAAELESHLEFHIEDNLRAGMPPEEARRQALIKLGGIDQTKESVRAQATPLWLDSLRQDTRFALRMLRKNPGFTMVAVLTLALGIGANTAIFSAVNAILIEPLPYAGSSRLVMIGAQRKVIGYQEEGSSFYVQSISPVEADAIRTQTSSFEQFALYEGGRVDRIRTRLMPDLVGSVLVSANFFPMLGVKPLLGRIILPADERGPGARVAVISYKLWQEDFGGDQNILTRTVLIGAEPYAIIGVMPRQFDYGFSGKGLWEPAAIENPRLLVDPTFKSFALLARLKKGASLKQANSQLATVSARLAAAYPKADKDILLAANGIKDTQVSPVRTALLILLAAVGFLLLLACVNISALLVARAWTRQREIAVRKALGATQSRIVRQLLSESLLLALMGGAVGLSLSIWGIRLLQVIAPPHTPRMDRVVVDGNVLWFTVAIAVLAAILFGIAPSIQASARRTGAKSMAGLGSAFSSGVTRERHALRSALIVAEVALAVVLVLGAGLMLTSFEKLVHVDTGLRTDHVLTAQVMFSDAVCGYKTPEKCRVASDQVLDRIRSIPGVQRVAASLGFALLGGNYVMSHLYVNGSPDDKLASVGESTGSMIGYHSVTPGYFEILGIRFLGGRNFNDGDSANSPRVAIVNQKFAGTFLTGDPMGQRIAFDKDKNGIPQWMEIVGEVADDRDFALKVGAAPLFYAPATQINFLGVDDFLVRTTENPMALAPAIEKQIWSVDKDAPIPTIQSLDRHISESVAQPRFQASLLACFGALGLLLAVVGIYGVMSYAVVQRTHEIGVRIALGARRSDVIGLIVGEGAKLAASGVILGLLASWGLTRFLRSLLFEITPTDPATFAGVSALLMLAALAACYIPARRAMRIDPVAAIRSE
jgi:predicted permease